MEHLALPSRDRNNPIEVLYICEEDYDGGPFQEYPMRKGWKKEELFCRKAWNSTFKCDDVYCSIHKCSCQRAHSVPENTAFVQNWLFFGLLSAFFEDSVDLGAFISESGTLKKTISTSALQTVATSWLSDCRQLSLDDKTTVVLKIEEALQEAHDVFLFICASCTVDPAILLSISLLGEFLVSRANKLIPLSLTDCTEWRGGDLEGEAHTKYLISHMLEGGWCRSDIQKLRLFDVSGMCFASGIGSKRSNFDHILCKESKCLQLQHYDSTEYTTKHIDLSCSCKSVSAHVGSMVSTLEKGCIPLIRLKLGSGDQQEQVEVVSKTSNCKYVAISHVWSDGLGNKTDNSLPLCQLRQLGKVVNQLNATEAERSVLFWMDTLACPVESHVARRQAIRLMGKTYQDADKVLMLDSSLMNLNHREMSDREIAMRVYLSTWGRRLWTLQEGIFAKSLHIQFADGTIDFDTFRSRRMHAFGEEPEPGEPWCLLLYGDQIRGYDRLDKDSADQYRKLHSLANSLHSRSVSKASDEPICLATLLGMEMEDMVDAPDPDKMKVFWSMLSSYNRTLLWWDGPCLKDKGYRWAPSSLLNQKFAFPAPDLGEHSVATRTDCGLLLKYPGIMLGKASAWLGPGIWLRDAKMHTFPFYSITCFDKEIPAEHTSLALILQEPIRLTQAIAHHLEVCLVAINRSHNGILYATSLGKGLLNSGSGDADEGMTAHAQKDLDGLKKRMEMRSILTLRDEFELLRARDGSEPSAGRWSEILSHLNSAEFLSPTEGYHLGFDFTLLPHDQQWCIERDVAWQQPLGIEIA